MTKLLESIIEREKPRTRLRVRAAAFMDTSDLGAEVKAAVDAVSTKYLETRMPHTRAVRPETGERYRKELEEAVPVIEAFVREWWTTYRRRHEVALIEYPLIRHLVMEGLKGKKVRFALQTAGDSNVLTVHLVWDRFLEIPVTVEDAPGVTRLINYYINRPDCARKELPGAVIRSNPRLAKSWEQVSTLPGEGD